jgi:uncharacterized protein YmfQ (DUF2313 family)
MPAPQFSVDDYTSALQALLPRGRAWPRDTDAVQTQAIRGMAEAFERSGARGSQLLVESFPSTAYELLGEWESTLGLPGIYGTSPTETGDRQAQVVSALTDTGGQSVAYFVQLAARLGYTITITQFRPYRVGDPVGGPIYGVAWAFAWQVNAASNTVDDSSVESSVEDVLATWSNVALQSIFEKFKPAHTVPIFSFS